MYARELCFVKGLYWMDELIKLALQNGFSQWAALNMDAVVPLEDVREMCAVNRCGCWGTNWACPPGCGNLKHISSQLAQYHNGLLIQTTGTLTDDFDVEGMNAISNRHCQQFKTYTRQVRLLYPHCLPLSAGPCLVCRQCTYPHRPCRYPDKRISSMEAYGLLVSDICLRSGLGYNYGPRTLTYTSCILFN